MNDLSLGTQNHRTAYLYFDFNSPEVTYITTNEIGIGTIGVAENTNIGFVLYPNPIAAGQLINFNLGERVSGLGTIIIFDISDRNFYSSSIIAANSTQQIFILQLSPRV